MRPYSVLASAERDEVADLLGTGFLGDRVDGHLPVRVRFVRRDERPAVQAGLVGPLDGVEGVVDADFEDVVLHLDENLARGPEFFRDFGDDGLLGDQLRDGGLRRLTTALLDDLEALEQVDRDAVLVELVDQDDEGAMLKRLPLVFEDRDAVPPLVESGEADGPFAHHDAGDALFAFRLLGAFFVLPTDLLRIALACPALARLAIPKDHFSAHASFVDLLDLRLRLGETVADVEVEGGAHLGLDHFTKPDGLLGDQGRERDDALDDGITTAGCERDDDGLAGEGQEAHAVELLVLEGPEPGAVLVGDRRNCEVEMLKLVVPDHGDEERIAPVLDGAGLDFMGRGVLGARESETREIETRLGLGHFIVSRFFRY